MNFAEHKSGATTYRFNVDYRNDIEELFQPKADDNNEMGMERGRASIFTLNNHNYVLKHYHRGGAVAHISRDSYVWLGENRTRAFRELELLDILNKDGLPVPVPVAARVVRHGLLYECDLVTEQIQDVQTLSDILSSQHLSPADWKSIGLCIRRFHEKNVYHADLNASNILLDDQHNVYLIDFDKSEIRKGGLVWKQEVLARLRRSLMKFLLKKQVFYFSDEDWLYLINAYTDHRSA